MYVIPAVLYAFFGAFSSLGTPLRQVNRMCSSLTDQVRSIATVTTAVAKGDLTRKIEIQVEGEMATLKTTVNSMVDQLSAFASEVTRVALEVGTQGILGGQARVEGVQGTWADLTLNVNVSSLSFGSLPFLVSSAERFDVSNVENGEQLDGPGALDLGGHQSGRTG
jgi:HAMP domain-containing protein